MMYSEPLQLQEWVMKKRSNISGLDALPGLPFGHTVIQNHALGLYALDDPDLHQLAKKWMEVYECFIGLTADSITKAFALLRELSDNGDQAAMTAMSLLIIETEFDAGLKLLETSAQMGCPIAMACFAMFVMGTMGTEDLHLQARRYLEQAAETGMPRAREWIARDLIFGHLGPKDPKLGHDMMERLALEGQSLFDYLYVGYLFFHEVVHEWEGGDLYATTWWLEQAANKGSAQAAGLLAQIYGDSLVEPFDKKEAKLWKRRAKELKRAT